MSTHNSSLATRIALRSGAIFAAISALVLITEWIVLSSVITSSIITDAPTANEAAGQATEAVFELASSTIRTVMIVSAVALLAVTTLGALISYRAARVSLQRVAAVNAHTRRITASNLDERLNLDGPQDEIKDLADTIDSTLAQLEMAFAQQERFAANASHELRTPLAVIRTSVESLSKRDTAGSEEDVDRSLRSVSRMELVLDSLMVLAHTKRLPLDLRFPVDLSAMLHVVWEEVATQFSDRHIAVTIGADDGVHTTGDETLLVQAVHNVLQNAARHTPPGGTAVFTVTKNGDRAVLTFANDGDPITTADAEMLIEPFNRGPNSRLSNTPGSGLGLSIVNSIIRQHEGTFNITPNSHGGVTATILLPYTEVRAGEPIPDPDRATELRQLT